MRAVVAVRQGVASVNVLVDVYLDAEVEQELHALAHAEYQWPERQR